MEIPEADYDGAWKEALEFYLFSLLELCFPGIARQIDWEAGIQFLDQELQEIVRDAALGKQRVDKLIQVTRLDGEPQLVLIHCEVQAQPDPELPRRLYQYHHRIQDRFGLLTATLAVLADENPEWRPSMFEERLWGCAVRFEFPTCKLLDFPLDELKRSSSPGAIIIAAHLEAAQTKQDMERRLQSRWEMNRRLYEAGLEKQDILELYRLLDWLMRLPGEMKLQFNRRLLAYEEEKRMPYITSIEQDSRETGRQEGRQEGLQEGREAALREAVLDLLMVRFPGASLDEIRMKLASVHEEQMLRGLLRKVLESRSPQEFLSQLPP